MKILKSKAFKIALGLTIIFFLSKYIIELRYGYVDYFAAFEIAYETKENGKILTSSNWYQFESDIKWINFPYKPGCGRGGYFLSIKGAVGYDYSMYAPDYIDYGFDKKYHIKEDTINNTFIRFIESKDEFGVYLPTQASKGMASQFLIWPSEEGMKMKKELIEMVSTMSFKGM